MAETRKTSINTITMPVIMIVPMLAWIVSMYFPSNDTIKDHEKRISQLESQLKTLEATNKVERDSMQKDIDRIDRRRQ